MTRLAFDTSGACGSVAVERGGEIIARSRLEQRAGHASRLIGAIEDTLAAAGVVRSELESIVVGEGPGSFTGVRVAAATAKGLVRALGCPLYAVSSLAGSALAFPGSGLGSTSPTAPRYVLFDARSERVYGGCWVVDTDRVEELVAPHGGEISDVLASEPAADTLFLGDGAQQYRAHIEAAGFAVADASAAIDVADGLLRFLARAQNHPPVEDPGRWEPAYVRVSGAERLWAK